jgi:hypothetical protein
MPAACPPAVTEPTRAPQSSTSSVHPSCAAVPYPFEYSCTWDACSHSTPETFISPTHVPKRYNPVGSYRRTFRLPRTWPSNVWQSYGPLGHADRREVYLVRRPAAIAPPHHLTHTAHARRGCTTRRDASFLSVRHIGAASLPHHTHAAVCKGL